MNADTAPQSIMFNVPRYHHYSTLW